MHIRRTLWTLVAVAGTVLGATAVATPAVAGNGSAAAVAQAGANPAVARPPAGVEAPRNALAATKNKVLAGQNGNLSIITPQGDLVMYYHHGWINGTADFSPGYDRGDGWNAFTKVISFGVNNSYDNMYLATTSNGRMYAYYWKHNEQRWVNPSGTLVGEGWQGTQKLISGGNRGYLSWVYRITDDGTLSWYRWSGVPGEGGFWEIGGIPIGSGWGGFRYVAASRSTRGTALGEFFAIPSNGDVNYYEHDHWNNTWDNKGVPQVIGRGWYGGGCGYQTVQAGGYGTVYAVDGSGRLRWWQHYTTQAGHHWYPEVACGAVVGEGWM